MALPPEGCSFAVSWPTLGSDRLRPEAPTLPNRPCRRREGLPQTRCCKCRLPVDRCRGGFDEISTDIAACIKDREQLQN